MLIGPLITGGLQAEATAAREQAEDIRDRAEALESQLQEKVRLCHTLHRVSHVQSGSPLMRHLHVALCLISWGGVFDLSTVVSVHFGCIILSGLLGLQCEHDCLTDHLLSTKRYRLIPLKCHRNTMYQMLSTAYLYRLDCGQGLSLRAAPIAM